MGPLPLWTPTPQRIAQANVTAFAAAVGRTDASYDELWRWSIADPNGFWGAIWDEFGVPGRYGTVLANDRMPGAQWFPGTTVNYAQRLLHHGADDALAIHHVSESRPLSTWTRGELRDHTAKVRAGLVAMGVTRGDRVAAVLPNLPETIAAFAAVASIGAVWASAAPEFGPQAVIDRFAQLQPRVLLTVDGYRYGGKEIDLRAAGAEIAHAIGADQVTLGYLDGTGWESGFLPTDPPPLTYEPVAFTHPLWVLFSSGTTGLPKPIVHGHGGMLLEHLKTAYLHLDAHPGDRFFWFTTTGWMMWNFLLGVLHTDAEIVLFDGNPGGDVLWQLAADAHVTTFGTSAAYLSACEQRDVVPHADGRDLTRLTAVGSTGSPLSPASYRWVYDQLSSDVWLFSTSGGTDVCTAFVGGVPTLPVYEGELQARSLGAPVAAFDEHGRSVVGEVGELVLTAPMPCMPVGFWGDTDGSRYRESYFDTWPGVWRHGDWITITDRGTAVIHGRSDATINRGGVRMGTSEIYTAVAAVPAVVDALVVDISRPDAENWMPLFVVLADGVELDDDLVGQIRAAIRTGCSPRHVPDEVRQIAVVPRTLSGKALEVPVKRILLGAEPSTTTSLDALADPSALEPFVALAGEWARGGVG